AEVRGDRQLATSADLHAGDALLPALDQTAQRELDGLSAPPGGVELLAGVVLDAGVVHRDGVAGLGLVAITDDDVADDELGGGRPGRSVELGLCAICHGSIKPEGGTPVNVTNPLSANSAARPRPESDSADA